MKKFAICFLIIAVVCTSAFATTLQVGATGRFGGSLVKAEDYKNIDNYDFGADVRFNVSLFNLSANVLFGKNDGNFVLNSIVTANARFDLNIVNFAIGAGYALPFEFGDGGVLIDGKPASQAWDVFKNSQILARAAVGVNLGSIDLSVDYKIPFSTIGKAIKNEEYKSFEQGKLAFSVLVNLF